MSYTVKDIKDLPDDMVLIIQKDTEGNSYSPLAGVDPNAIYVVNNTWSGDVYSTDWGPEDVLMDEDMWKELKKKSATFINFISHKLDG